MYVCHVWDACHACTVLNVCIVCVVPLCVCVLCAFCFALSSPAKHIYHDALQLVVQGPRRSSACGAKSITCAHVCLPKRKQQKTKHATLNMKHNNKKCKRNSYCSRWWHIALYVLYCRGGTWISRSIILMLCCNDLVCMREWNGWRGGRAGNVFAAPFFPLGFVS